MPKTMADLRSADTEAIHDVAEMKGILFKEAYEEQDGDTRVLISKVAAELRKYHRSDLAEPYLTMSLDWLAIELVKDMAMTGIRLGNFQFAKGVCVGCGREE